VTALILGLDVRHPEKINIGTPLMLDFQETGLSGEEHTRIIFRAGK
jgi:hypothetical protein